jgi:hypothetical protein
LAEIESALDAIRTDRMEGLQNFQGGLSLANRQLIVDFAAANRMPAIYQARLFVAAGGLMAWAPDQTEQLRIAARMVARILRGTSPGDIPVVLSTPLRPAAECQCGTRHRAAVPLRQSWARLTASSASEDSGQFSSDLPNCSPPS